MPTAFPRGRQIQRVSAYIFPILTLIWDVGCKAVCRSSCFCLSFLILAFASWRAVLLPSSSLSLPVCLCTSGIPLFSSYLRAYVYSICSYDTLPMIFSGPDFWQPYIASSSLLTYSPALGSRAGGRLLRWVLDTVKVIFKSLRKSQSTGNKPVTWNDFLMSWVLIRWNPKTRHISWNWTDFLFSMDILATLSLISNWSHGSRKMWSIRRFLNNFTFVFWHNSSHSNQILDLWQSRVNK